jgi:alanine racemase
MPLRAVAQVNLAAIGRNVARLRGELRHGARLCAVVKAGAYGHGAVPVARAALAAGADWLAVAAAGEAAELRAAGIGGRILVMGALGGEELAVALDAEADVVAWSAEFLAALERSKRSARVHVKLDTGMGRLGTRDARIARELADAVGRAGPQLVLAGAMTHFATAEEEDPRFLREQLARFAPFASELRRGYPGLLVHAANSAATLAAPEAHFDMVRCGIAMYGCDPAQGDPVAIALEPALALRSYVAAVKRTRPGESAGYNRRWIASRETWLATLPIGYADGVRRALAGGCEVLIDGRRHPLVGNVSMDNITVELGERGPHVRVGTPATLIGADGEERQTAEDLARIAGTINYEILCGIGARVPRHHHRDGVPDG